MFPALVAVLGLPNSVAGGVLRRGLKFQTFTNNLNKSFYQFREFWVPPSIILYTRYLYTLNFIHIRVQFKQQTQFLPLVYPVAHSEFLKVLKISKSSDHFIRVISITRWCSCCWQR